jgi:hypothetical protein
MAEIGARHGIAFAEKAEIDPSVLAMIYERAAHQRIQGDDASALDALRNYWRCALLGNVCWQLAHTPKAQPVDGGPDGRLHRRFHQRRSGERDAGSCARRQGRHRRLGKPSSAEACRSGEAVRF